MQKYSLKVLSSKDYNNLATKYPIKVRNRIRDSKGFTDINKKVSFVRATNDKYALAGTAIHEIIELVSNVSLHEECRLRFKDSGKTDASVQYSQSPEYAQQMDLFNTIQEPYMQNQYDLYKNTYAPNIQALGAELYKGLDPASDPVWDKTWQQTKEKTMAPFDTQSRQMSQRFASTGALNNSGQVNKAFQQLDYNKQKSIESITIDQAIAEWQAKQQGISNMQNFINSQPQFSIPMPSSNANIVAGKPASSTAAQAWSTIAPMSGLSDIFGNAQTGGDYSNKVNWFGSSGGASA